jgi:hypothetical protein
MVGFRRYRPLGEWHDELTGWLLRRLDWPADHLSWYGDCAPAVVAFSCLALGALQGKFALGEIDDAGFLLADAHLPAFILMQMQDIAAAYEVVRGSEPELPLPP